MRLIFSRKGFDSTAGGCPSPIIGGTPVSLPIPTKMPTPICYDDLLGHPYAELVTDLTKSRLTGATRCHLDPDIDATCLNRVDGWRGCLGQVSAARSHLVKQGVGPGDLFLFWGLFREAEYRDGCWDFVGGPEHRIFGWLQVDEVLALGSNGGRAADQRPWLKEHPHARDGWSESNALYVARERLDIPGVREDLAGWGVLRRGYRLTAPHAQPSVWKVPAWLNPALRGVGMTYHPQDRWNADGTLRAAARGQEFVANVASDPALTAWLSNLFEDIQ